MHDRAQFAGLAESTIAVRLPDGFDFDRTVRSHGWYDLPPFSYDREAGCLELAYTAAGGVARMKVSPGRRRSLQVAVAATSPAAGATAAAVVASVLRLDEDLRGLRDVLTTAPELLRCADAGAGRLLRAPTVFEDTVKMLCTVNCSWALTRSMVRRLIEAKGAPGPGGVRAFPTAQELAGEPESFFRDVVRAGYRAPFFAALVARVASGELDLEGLRDPSLPSDAAVARLRSIKGIGDYATDNLMRLLGRYDRLGIDSWCRKTFRRLYPRVRGDLDTAMHRRYRRFAPYQGLAMWLDLTRHWHDGETELWP